jgi:glycosyltransferase involved in cell wall biosynthesis
MSVPLVSIIIPAYNASRWIRQTIASAQAQTWPAVEIVVVDDGSTDDTLTIAQSHVGPHLRVIASTNRGASSARNRGVAAARGDYLQYLDADDLLSPDKIAMQMECLASEPAGRLATSGLVFFNDDNPPKSGLDSDGLPHAGDCDSPLNFLLRLYGLDGPAGMVQTSQWLVPRCVANAAGPWDETLTVDDDGEYFARTVEHSVGVRYVPRGRVYYRKHSSHGSLSGHWQRSEAHLASAIRSLHGKRAVLIRLGADACALRTLSRFYCEWALAAYPRFPALVGEALEGARHCGDPRPVPKLATPKGQCLQSLVGWRLARRIQTWLQ